MCTQAKPAVSNAKSTTPNDRRKAIYLQPVFDVAEEFTKAQYMKAMLCAPPVPAELMDKLRNPRYWLSSVNEQSFDPVMSLCRHFH